jgi:hypothetical protein
VEGTVSCPQEPVPLGWKVWRQTEVPTPLVQLAIGVRDHIRDFAYGSIAKTVDYSGQTVGVFVSHHTWTYRNGVLVTGICIPGASLLVQQPTTGPQPAVQFQDSLATPDPTAAVYGGEPPEETNWAIVAETGAAVVVIIASVWLAVHFAGRPGLR